MSVIFVDSALIDFGEVCQRSVKTKYLTVGNNLNQHIHIVVNVSKERKEQNKTFSSAKFYYTPTPVLPTKMINIPAMYVLAFFTG